MGTKYRSDRADEEPVVPVELESYLALELAEGGRSHEELHARLQHERIDGRDPIELTSGADGLPHGVTPEMGAWFVRTVGARRNAALAAVCARFAADRFRDGSTVLVEHETDRIAAMTAQRKTRLIEEFERSDVSAELKRKATEARQEFSVALDEQGGRQPRMFHPALYFIGLAVILLLEIPINYESFVQWVHAPIFSVGLTFVTALLIGAASHVHGTLLRQYDYYFGPHDRVRWVQGAKLIGLGSVLLSVALLLAGYARYAFFQQQLMAIIISGGVPPSALGNLVAMLASNLGVYLVGAAWAFFTHDEIPDYPSKQRKADRAQAAFDTAFARQVAGELNRLDQKAAADTAKAISLDKTQRSAPNYLDNRRLFSTLCAKDDEVVAALIDYRTALARRAEHARFACPDRSATGAERTIELSAGQWAARELRLRYAGALGE
jgi:hypothetical protein